MEPSSSDCTIVHAIITRLRTGADYSGRNTYWDSMEYPHLLVTGGEDEIGRALGRIMLQAAASGWRLSTINGADKEAFRQLRKLTETMDLRQQALTDDYMYPMEGTPLLILLEQPETLIARSQQSEDSVRRILHAGGAVNIHLLVPGADGDELTRLLFDEPRIVQRFDAGRSDKGEAEHPAGKSHDIDEPGLLLFPPVPHREHTVRNLFDWPVVQSTHSDDEWDDELDSAEPDDSDSDFDETRRIRLGIDQQNNTVNWDTFNDRHLLLRGNYERSTINEIILEAQTKTWMTISYDLDKPTLSENLHELRKAEQGIDFIQKHFDDATPCPLLIVIEGLPELREKAGHSDGRTVETTLLERLNEHLRNLMSDTENDVHLLLASRRSEAPHSFASITITDNDGHADYLSPSLNASTPITLF